MRQTNRTNKQTDETNKQMRQTNKTNKQMRQTDKASKQIRQTNKTNRQDKQANKQTDKQTYRKRARETAGARVIWGLSETSAWVTSCPWEECWRQAHSSAAALAGADLSQAGSCWHCCGNCWGRWGQRGQSLFALGTGYQCQWWAVP